MKNTLIIAMVAILFSGCSNIADAIKNPTLTKIYDTTKVVYVNGREVVISNYDLLSDEAKAELAKIDDVANRVEDAKNIITK